LARKKGDKDYSAREKQMMISLINDYSLFGATDDEIIRMLSLKLGKDNSEKISESLFYRLKKEAMKKRGESEQWLDSYTKYQFIEFYRKRMEELEYVQKTLLKVLIEEKEKDQKDKSLINQISKTIAENSKILAEFGMAPPVLYKIKSLISSELSNINNGENNMVNKEINTISIQPQNTKSAFYLSMDNEYNNESVKYNDSQRVF
jgi:hypothetical protein